MRADAAANRRDLLESAARLISEHGVEVSLRAVAQEAGVGIATLYRHFPTRADLLVALVRRNVEGVLAATQRFHDSRAPLLERWRTFAQELADLDVGALAVPVFEADPSWPHNPQVVAMRAEAVTAVDRVLAVARAAGQVGADLDAARFFFGVVAMTRPLPAVVETELPGQTQWLLEVYLRGLAAPAAEQP